MFQKWIVILVASLCENTKNTGIFVLESMVVCMESQKYVRGKKREMSSKVNTKSKENRDKKVRLKWHEE